MASWEESAGSSCAGVAAVFEDVAAVEDAACFVVDLFAGLEDFEEDGFVLSTHACGGAFGPLEAVGGAVAAGEFREFDGGEGRG